MTRLRVQFDTWSTIENSLAQHLQPALPSALVMSLDKKINLQRANSLKHLMKIRGIAMLHLCGNIDSVSEELRQRDRATDCGSSALQSKSVLSIEVACCFMKNNNK